MSDFALSPAPIGPLLFAGAAASAVTLGSTKTLSLPVLKRQFLVLVAVSFDDRSPTVLSVNDTRNEKWARTATSPPFLGTHWTEVWTVFAKHDDTITITVQWDIPVFGGLIVAVYDNVTAVGSVAASICTGCTGESVAINAKSALSLLVGTCYMDNCQASPGPGCGPAFIEPGPGQIQRASANVCAPGGPGAFNGGLAYDLEEKAAAAGTNSFSFTTPIAPFGVCGFAGGLRTLVVVELT